MLKLRLYTAQDAAAVLSWCPDEGTYYRWSAGAFGDYPATAEQMNAAVRKNVPFLVTEDDEPVGFFCLREIKEPQDGVRFAFVILSPEKRGRGMGKEMIRLGLAYAKEHGKSYAQLAVFADNDAARYCYRAAGFREVPGQMEVYTVCGEEKDCYRMENFGFDLS